MRNSMLAAAVAGLVAIGAPVAAEPLPGNLTPTDPAGLQALLLDEGYRAKIGVDTVGDPMITSATAGHDFEVMFYDCTENTDCRSIDFHAAFSDPDRSTPDDMNAWNADHRYVRAYLDQEGNAILRMDVAMDGEGLGKEVFLKNLSLWNSLMAEFVGYVWD